MRGEQIIPKSPLNATVTSGGLMGRNDVQWTAPADGERHVVCGNDI
jgi:hypothetical protein